MRRHGDRDETSDVDVVFDAMNSAARTPVSHSDVQVMFDWSLCTYQSCLTRFDFTNRQSCLLCASDSQQSAGSLGCLIGSLYVTECI